jgi:hypothetical protein
VTASAFEILGVPSTATESEIRAAWKSLALVAHPDHGGSHSQMVRLNQALEQALKSQSVQFEDSRPSRRSRITRSFAARDVSSFTINSLPVDAFETLVIAAAHCGQITEDDPPYLIEFTLSDMSLHGTRNLLCRCELMPEAGATTVHLALSVAGRVELESVRDALIDIINEIDS